MERSPEGNGGGARDMAGAGPGTIRRCPAHARIRARAGLADMNAPVSVIDRSRGIAARAFDRAGPQSDDPAVIERLGQLRAKAVGQDAAGILRLALEEFPGRTAIVSSFGAESVVGRAHV